MSMAGLAADGPTVVSSASIIATMYKVF